MTAPEMPSESLLVEAMAACDQSFVIASIDQPGSPLVYVNPAFTRLTGYAQDEVLGRPCSFLQGDDRDQEAIATMRAAIAAHAPCEVTVRNYRKDGSLFWNRLHLSPLRINGGVHYYLAHQVDDTQNVLQRRELDRQSSFIATLADNVPGVIYQFRMDAAGAMSFPYISEKIVDLYGVSAQTAMSNVDTLFTMVIAEDLAPLRGSIMESYEQHREWAFEFRIRREDGSLRWIAGRSVPEAQGDGSTLWSGIMMDRTKDKRVEIELARAKQAAEQAAAARSELVANVSHELRTPLAGIAGCLDILQTSADEKTRDRLQRQMAASTSVLMGLINGLLDEAQIQGRRLVLDREPFTLGEMIASVMDSVRVTAERRGLELQKRIDPELPACFLGDGARISQIIVNLLGNAIKYTQHGHITVEVAGEPHKEAWMLRIAVIDTGPGISLEHQRTIFDRFRRGKSDGDPVSGRGLGIGLHISRMVARAMGGDLTVSSVLGEGSAFICAVPVQEHRTASEPSKPPPANHQHAGSGRALLVEDDAVLGEVGSFHLRNLGFEVSWVQDGEAAVEAAANEAFDCILMDVRMPKLNGREATERIRKLPRGQHPTIIAVTAQAMPEDISRCLAAGMDDHLVKPYTAQDLTVVLNRCRPGPSDAPSGS